jgi:cell wall-associated NlpC family hydrolase
LVRRESLNWKVIPAREARCGDVIVLRMRGEPMHVGMVLGDQQMLHIERGINSVIERYGSLRWKNRVVGFFRHHHTET